MYKLEPIHSIQMAARRAGLSPVLIRAWEQRYSAVSPNRSATKRRLYSEAEITRLSLLKQVTDAGHSIGQVARLPDEQLRELLAQRTAPEQNTKLLAPRESTEAWLNESLVAVRELDAFRFDQALKSASSVLGIQGVLVRIIAPLAETIGEWWRDGKITAAHEHFGTALMRDFLGDLRKPFAGAERSPTLIVATPAGQLHEMGALMAGALAANLGWRVTQLGASLPAAEIASAARQQNARAVALSIVYPEDDPSLPAELHSLRDLLPSETKIIAGGRAAKAYRETLNQISATSVEDLAQLGIALDQVRAGDPAR
ncbi:MAG TPA: MerR family transcriptional regulator [Verrucomicrobiae bacterium]